MCQYYGTASSCHLLVAVRPLQRGSTVPGGQQLSVKCPPNFVCSSRNASCCYCSCGCRSVGIATVDGVVCYALLSVDSSYQGIRVHTAEVGLQIIGDGDTAAGADRVPVKPAPPESQLGGRSAEVITRNERNLACAVVRALEYVRVQVDRAGP